MRNGRKRPNFEQGTGTRLKRENLSKELAQIRTEKRVFRLFYESYSEPIGHILFIMAFILTEFIHMPNLKCKLQNVIHPTCILTVTPSTQEYLAEGRNLSIL